MKKRFNNLLNLKRRVANKLLFFLFINILSSENQILLDEIVCSKITESGVSVVFLSDSWLPNPMGHPVKLEEKIIKMLWLAIGEENGIKLISDTNNNEYAEEYFQKLQNERGLTRDQIKEMCKKSGFTIEEVKKELNEQNLLGQCTQSIIALKSDIYVSAEEIEAYYNNNPEYSEESYIIQRGIYNGNISEMPTKISLKNAIKWEDSYSIKKNELSEAFSKINNISNGEFITIIQNENNVEIYKLITKNLSTIISLEERYELINKILEN